MASFAASSSGAAEGEAAAAALPLPYHPDNCKGQESGYFPNLTDAHKESLERIKAMIDADEEVMDLFYIKGDRENVTLRLLRFLRARKFDASASYAMLKKDLLWRRDVVGFQMKSEFAQDILQCDLNEIHRYFPCWIQGYDKQQRPVSYRQFGRLEIWSVMKMTTMDRLVKFHAWESEMSLRLMEIKSQETGYNIETMVVIIDAAGWSMKLATGDAFTFIKGMATTDADHYPERLGTLLIINAPAVLSFAWKITSAFLDDVTKAKISILSSPTEWQPRLFSLVDRSQVPKMYGGTADDLKNNCILSMNPPIDST